MQKNPKKGEKEFAFSKKHFQGGKKNENPK